MVSLHVSTVYPWVILILVLQRQSMVCWSKAAVQTSGITQPDVNDASSWILREDQIQTDSNESQTDSETSSLGRLSHLGASSPVGGMSERQTFYHTTEGTVSNGSYDKVGYTDKVVSYCEESSTKNDHVTSCTLQVANQSADYFMDYFSKKEHVYINIELVFADAEVKRTYNLINPTSWIMTQKYGVVKFMKWSLIWPSIINVIKKPFTGVKLYFKTSPENCRVCLGGVNTTLAMQMAIENFTRDIVRRFNNKTIYANNKWCFHELTKNYNQTAAYKAAIVFGWYFPIVSHRCIDTSFNWSTMDVVSSISETDIEQSIVSTLGPSLCGIILVCYLPLCLIFLYPPDSGESNVDDLVSGQPPVQRQGPNSKHVGFQDYDNNFVYLNGDLPISISKCVLGLFGLEKRHPILTSRIRRCMFLFLSPIIVYMSIIMAVIEGNGNVRDIIQHEVPIAFITILEKQRGIANFVPFFGGPIGMFALYFLLGTFFLVCPKDLNTILRWKIVDSERNDRTPLMLKVVTVQDLSSLQIVDTSRRSYVSMRILANFLMVWNPAYWSFAIKLQFRRIENLYIELILMSNKTMARTLLCLILPLYIALSFVELVLCFVLYVIPLFSFIILTYVAVYKHLRYNYYFRFVPSVCFVIWGIVTLTVFHAIVTVLATHTMAYLASNLLNLIFALIVWPSTTFGQTFFGIAIMFYLYKLVNRIGQEYNTLLADVVDICSRLQRQPWSISLRTGTMKLYSFQGFHLSFNNVRGDNVRTILNNDNVEFSWDVSSVNVRRQNKQTLIQDTGLYRGVPRSLFEFVVQKHKPLFIDVAKTLVEIFLIICLLLATIDVTNSARAKGSFSDVMHVVFIVVMGVLPHLLHKSHSKVRKSIWLKQIERTILDYASRNRDIDINTR